MSDELRELPEGWVWTNFEELAERIPNALKAGPFGSALKKSFYVDSGYKIYGQEQVINENPFLGNYYIDENRYEALKSCAVKSGDILISLVGTIGKVLILPEGIEPGIINPRLVKLSLDKLLIDNKFIKKYLESPSVHNYFSRLSHGGTMEILNLSILKTLTIPLPPLNEQKRIVAKIEDLNDRTQRAKEALDSIPQLCDRFRQSVLAAAFRGDLTADWREQNPDVEPASVLLERIKEEILQKKKRNVDELPDLFSLPNNWKWSSLSNICKVITDGDHQVIPKVPEGIPLLDITNIRTGNLDFSNTRRVSEDYYKAIPEYKKPQRGNILYSVVGSYGIPALIDTDIEFYFQRNMALLKPCSLINPIYLLYALRSNFVFEQATELSTGTSQPLVSLTALSRIKVPVATYFEQKEIVLRIENLFQAIENVEQEYQTAKANLEQMGQSILAKAFRGELVPQDPEDEPASVLLERIRAERDKLNNSKPKSDRTSKQKRKTVEGQGVLPGFE